MTSRDQYETRLHSPGERGRLKSAVTLEGSPRRDRDYARATLTRDRPMNDRGGTLDLADLQARGRGRHTVSHPHGERAAQIRDRPSS